MFYIGPQGRDTETANGERYFVPLYINPWAPPHSYKSDSINEPVAFCLF